MNVPVIVLGDISGKYIEAIESERGVVSVARHVHELAEVLGIAQTGIARAVLLISGFEDLTASLVNYLAESDVGVVAVVDPGDPEPLENIRYLSALADPSEVIEALETAAEEVENTPVSVSGRGPLSAVELSSAVLEDVQPDRQGKIITFWGPAGAPGRSTLALNCAAILADQQHTVCIVDADTYAPSLSSLLGMMDDYSTLSQLCHLADRGNLETEKIAEIMSTVKIESGTLDVVTGITRADRWPEIRSQALESVLETLTAKYDFVLVDAGFSLEADEELSFDGVAPRRNAATLTAIDQADEIILVGVADALGVPRVMKAISELLSTPNVHVEKSKVHVWINKVRPGSIGPQPEEQILHSWQRFGPQLPIEGFIPWNPDAIDKSWLTGQTLAESAPSSDVCQALRTLIESLIIKETKARGVDEFSSDDLTIATRSAPAKESSHDPSRAKWRAWKRKS